MWHTSPAAQAHFQVGVDLNAQRMSLYCVSVAVAKHHARDNLCKKGFLMVPEGPSWWRQPGGNQQELCVEGPYLEQ